MLAQILLKLQLCTLLPISVFSFCTNPTWHKVFSFKQPSKPFNPLIDSSPPLFNSSLLVNSTCPEAWHSRWVPAPKERPGGGKYRPGDMVVVCTRKPEEFVYGGVAGNIAFQSSAIISQGYQYSKIRGHVGAVTMGSPDGFRRGEPGRSNDESIDRPFQDGVTFNRYSPTLGRIPVASYAAGLGYSNRYYDYYPGGNCFAHGGSALSPDFLTEEPQHNHFCDSAMRGGYGTNMESIITIPSNPAPFTITLEWNGTVMNVTDTIVLSDATSITNVLRTKLQAATSSIHSLTKDMDRLIKRMEFSVKNTTNDDFRITVKYVADPVDYPLVLTLNSVETANLSSVSLGELVIAPYERNCQKEDGEPNVCDSARDCEEKGCYYEWTGKVWPSTNLQSLLWYNSSTLVKGERESVAMVSDFSGSDFSSPAIRGEFLHYVDNDESGTTFVTDPIEARIMAGQPSALRCTGDSKPLPYSFHEDEDGDFCENNEEVGVLQMEVEIFGCPLEPSSICGDGIVQDPETCDLGAGMNTIDSPQCDHACTRLKPSICNTIGKCPALQAPKVKEAMGIGGMPNKVGWITFEDIDYDLYFKGCSNFGVNDPGCGEENAVQRATCQSQDLIRTVLRDDFGKATYVCAPAQSSDTTSFHPDPYSMIISSPPGDKIKYAAVRGKITTHGLGTPEGFMNVPDFKFEWSQIKDASTDAFGIEGSLTENSDGYSETFGAGYRCFDEDDNNDEFTRRQSCKDIVGAMSFCTYEPYKSSCCGCGGGKSSNLNSRYVDGVSLTTRKSAEHDRYHLFTLAAGPTEKMKSGAIVDNFADLVGSDDRDGHKLIESDCYLTTTNTKGIRTGCYLGNCPCHGVSELHKSFVTTSMNQDSYLYSYSYKENDLDYSVVDADVFMPPEFVGPGASYCDAVTYSDDFVNAWNQKEMFTEASSVCVDGEIKSEEWWIEKGGPGHFRRDLNFITDQSLEIRVITGKNTVYENLAIRSVKLEVCACEEGKSPDECIHYCDFGTDKDGEAVGVLIKLIGRVVSIIYGLTFLVLYIRAACGYLPHIAKMHPYYHIQLAYSVLDWYLDMLSSANMYENGSKTTGLNALAVIVFNAAVSVFYIFRTFQFEKSKGNFDFDLFKKETILMAFIQFASLSNIKIMMYGPWITTLYRGHSSRFAYMVFNLVPLLSENIPQFLNQAYFLSQAADPDDITIKNVTMISAIMSALAIIGTGLKAISTIFMEGDQKIGIDKLFEKEDKEKTGIEKRSILNDVFVEELADHHSSAKQLARFSTNSSKVTPVEGAPPTKEEVKKLEEGLKLNGDDDIMVFKKKVLKELLDEVLKKAREQERQNERERLKEATAEIAKQNPKLLTTITRQVEEQRRRETLRGANLEMQISEKEENREAKRVDEKRTTKRQC